MINRFCFNGFDLESCHNLDDLHTPAPSPVGKFVPVTKPDADLFEEDNFYMKSTVMLTQDYEISFQNGFMNEHSSVFKKELQNYMEFVRTCLKKHGQEYLKNYEVVNSPFKPKMTTEDIILLYRPDHSETLLNGLSTYEKLKEFLDMVVDSVTQEMSLELVNVAHQILEAYHNLKDETTSISDLLELSSNKSENLKNIKLLDLSYLNLDRSERLQAQEAYRKFMEIFTATCLLVTAQYFENPYYSETENDVLKRPLSPFASDDEDFSLEQCPSKKVKFNF